MVVKERGEQDLSPQTLVGSKVDDKFADHVRRVGALDNGVYIKPSRRTNPRTLSFGKSQHGAHMRHTVAIRYASAAEHVGDALALTARYCRIGNEAERLKVNRSEQSGCEGIRARRAAS